MSGLNRPACKQDHERNLRRINRNARNLKVSRSHVQTPTKTPKASSLPPNIRTNPYFDVNLTPEGENHNITQHPPTPKYTGTLKRSASLSEKFKELISPTLTKLRKRAGKSSASSDESSERQVEEETQSEPVLGSTSGNPNEELYSYPSVDLPTYPLVYPSETETQYFDSNPNLVDDLEEQHRLIAARLTSIVEAKNLNTEVQTVEKTIIEPVTLAISTGQIILREPQTNNPIGIPNSLDKLVFPSFANNEEVINLEDLIDATPIRTIRGSTSELRKSKSNDSHSSSSSSEDTGDRNNERLTKESEEESVGPPNPPHPPNSPNSTDSSPPPPPPPPHIVIEEVNPMANPNRPLSIAAYPIFYGLPGTDPDMHVSRFLAVCAANRVLNQDYLRTFPATLDGAAFSWYQRQPEFDNWDALRNAFIA
jgi:hypothetical protein